MFIQGPQTLDEKRMIDKSIKKILVAAAIQVGAARIIDNIVINIKGY